MQPVNDDGTINFGRPYVPVGAVHGPEEEICMTVFQTRWERDL